MNKLNMNPSFLINTITAWEEPPRARHQVAQALSKNYPVVFVTANKKGLPSIKVQTINENFTVITPYFPLDYRIRYRIPLLNEIYQNWLYRKLVKKYRDFNVINFDYTATRIFKYFKDIIYYCNDSYYEISKKINPSIIAKYHQLCEAKVAAKSDFCVGVSPLIKNYLLQYNSDTIEIPLGSPDIGEYNIKIRNLPTTNKEIKVVLVGVIIKLTISYNIINQLLDEDGISVTLIGPVTDSFMKEIKNSDKLTVRGPLYGKELYEEINEYDVAIAPYGIKSKNDMLTGTGAKIYHYFSVGKPVVISYMMGLDHLNLNDNLIYIAKEEDEFPMLVRRAHEENTAKLIQQRIDYAQRNTWDKRMEGLIVHYETVKL